jgi:hypothetical protein
MHAILLVVSLCLVSQCVSAFAQSTIRNNDPVAGRISKAKEMHAWELEVADLGVIEFEVECDTGALYAQVVRVADNQLMSLDPIQGTNASHFSGGKNVVKASNAAVPKKGPFSARTSTRLVGGKYRIIIGSPGPGEIGPYQLTVVSPKFKTAAAAPMASGAPLGAVPAAIGNPAPADNTKALMEILEQLKRLNDRVDKLETRISEGK